MDSVLDIEPLDTFTLQGKGVVCVVASPFAMSRSRPEIVGRTVRVSDRLHEVMAIEAYAISCDIRHGEPIGLLLRQA